VGTPLDHRVSYVEFLLRAAHVPLHVYGNSWQRKLVYWQHRARFHNSVAGDAYASLLSASKICLGFVSSSNRDEYSMRTFEIPGSGSFLLAERSPTHEQLFAEGVEAEFFSSAEECANKSMFYLRNDAARQRIARAGYERCARSGYLLTDRIRAALEDLQATLKA
jgi:spore maturation protein CgeB